MNHDEQINHIFYNKIDDVRTSPVQLWVSISIDWSIKSILFNFDSSIDIDLSNGFLIIDFIDWLRIPRVSDPSQILINYKLHSWVLVIVEMHDNLYTQLTVFKSIQKE